MTVFEDLVANMGYSLLSIKEYLDIKPMRLFKSGMVVAAVVLHFNILHAHSGHAGEKLSVAIDKTIVIQLGQPASVVSVANPTIADVDVQSPRLILVAGREIGDTSINILSAATGALRTFDVTVTPFADNQITINMGADAVKTLKCEPRCVRVGNPGKDPEPGSGSGNSGGGGGAKSAGGGLLSAIGGGSK